MKVISIVTRGNGDPQWSRMRELWPQLNNEQRERLAYLTQCAVTSNEVARLEALGLIEPDSDDYDDQPGA